MTRSEYIASLRKELRKLPPEEIVAATDFFNEYLDDALESVNTEGLTEEEAEHVMKEKEEELVRAFGSPKAAAKQIKADYASRILEGEVPASKKKVSVGNKLSAVWWIIIGICSAPVSIPLAIILGMLAFTLLIAVVALLLGAFLGIVGGLFGGIAMIVVGCAALPVTLSSAAMFLGIGLMAVSLSLVVAVGMVLGIRALFRGIGSLARNINEKRRKKKLSEMNGGAGYETAQ